MILSVTLITYILFDLFHALYCISYYESEEGIKDIQQYPNAHGK